MKSFLRYHKLLLGLGAVTGVAACYYMSTNNRKVHASWTNNYQPHFCAKWDDNWDHRCPQSLVTPKRLKMSEKDENELNEELELSKPKAMRHLILIRHGQYHVWGKTDQERTLTDLGRVQADYTGKRLKELGLPYTVLVKSTMSRAQQTGTIILQSLRDIPVEECSLLREGAPVPPEPPLGSWKKEMCQFYVDGARIEAAFRKYFHRAEPKQECDSYTVLVCHANVIRYFVCRALQFPAEAWLRLSLNHASITWLSITPNGRVILRCFGDSGHMPPDVITSH